MAPQLTLHKHRTSPEHSIVRHQSAQYPTQSKTGAFQYCSRARCLAMQHASAHGFEIAHTLLLCMMTSVICHTEVSIACPCFWNIASTTVSGWMYTADLLLPPGDDALYSHDSRHDRRICWFMENLVAEHCITPGDLSLAEEPRVWPVCITSSHHQLNIDW